MFDCFSVLGEPRRPWLDPEALKERFHALSSEAHPDRVHGASEAERRAANERYTALNAAYQCLREPRQRLAHLIELERGVRPGAIQTFPSDLMALFLEVGARLKEADRLLAEKSALTSPLLKVQLFSRVQELGEHLSQLHQSLADRQAALENELRDVDREWCAAGAGARAQELGRLEEIYRRLSYFSRWQGQLQERILQLTWS